MKTISLATSIALFAASAFADSYFVQNNSGQSDWQMSGELDGSYAYTDRARIGDASIAEQSASAQYVVTAQYNEKVPLRVGLSWQRFSFSSGGFTAVPNTLQSLALVAGFDAEVASSIFVRIEAQPGFYSGSSHMSSRTFNVPVIVGGSYVYNKDLQFVLGISIDANRQYPVLPGGGIRWQINSQWLLNAVLPTPRVEFALNKKIALFAGAIFDEASYRVDPNFGQTHGHSKLNSALLDFTEIKVGGGAHCDLAPEVKLEIEAGCLVYRELDYHRTDVDLHSSDAAVYGRIGFSAKF